MTHRTMSKAEKLTKALQQPARPVAYNRFRITVTPEAHGSLINLFRESFGKVEAKRHA